MGESPMTSNGEDASPEQTSVVLSKTLVLLVLLLPALLVYLAFSFTPTFDSCGPPRAQAILEFSPSSNSSSEMAQPSLEGSMLNRNKVRDADCKINLFGGVTHFFIAAELRMAIFVGLLGALGGFGASFENRRIGQGSSVLNWFRHVMAGACLGLLSAIAFYLLVRAGAFNPGASVSSINPLGIAILSLVAGFSGPALFARLEALAMSYLAVEGDTPIAKALDRLDEKFGSLLANPVLDNWIGTVAVDLRASGRKIIKSETGDLHVGGMKASMAIFFFPAGLQTLWVEPVVEGNIAITDGNPDAGGATFEVSVDGEDLSVEMARALCTVPTTSNAPTIITAEISVGSPAGTDRLEGSHDALVRLIVAVRQKGVLVQSLVLPVTFTLPGSQELVS